MQSYKRYNPGKRTAKDTKRQKFHVRLVLDINASYRRNLLQGISQYVKENPNWEFESTYFFFGEKRHQENRFDKNKIDGLICFEPDEHILAEVIQSGIPAIIKSTDQPIRGHVNFITDHMKLCKMALDYFRHLGLRRFAYCGYGHLYWSRQRCKAIQHIAEINDYELHLFPKRSVDTINSWENEKSVLEEWLKSLPYPIGLLAANDFRGKEVLEVCADAEIKVPDEIAVIGVENDDCICPFTNPPLSSLARNLHKAGYQAASALNCLMSKTQLEFHEISIEPQEIIQRQSTNILAIDDPTVVKALHFIRDNKNTALTITDVADHVAVHSRILYDLFAKYLGHSVHDEIKRVRTDEIARLLVETDMTVAQIAREMGFKNADNFSRYFHQAKKMSPTDYRNRYNPFDESSGPPQLSLKRDSKTA